MNGSLFKIIKLSVLAVGSVGFAAPSNAAYWNHRHGYGSWGYRYLSARSQIGVGACTYPSRYLRTYLPEDPYEAPAVVRPDGSIYVPYYGPVCRPDISVGFSVSTGPWGYRSWGRPPVRSGLGHFGRGGGFHR